MSVELRSTELSRISHTAFFSGHDGVVEPLHKKHENSHTDLVGLRTQIISNFVFLQELKNRGQETGKKKFNPIHVITLGETPMIRGLLFAGISTPIAEGSFAATTGDALQSLLDKTQTQINAYFRKIAASIPTSKINTPAATPSEYDAATKDMSPYAVVHKKKDPAPAARQPINAVIQHDPPRFDSKMDISPYSMINKPSEPEAQTSPLPNKHARMTSIDNLMWGSGAVNNPSFGPNAGQTPDHKVATPVYMPQLTKGALANLELSFGSDVPLSSDSDNDTVADFSDPFVQVPMQFRY